MPKLAWTADIHLNFLSRKGIDQLCTDLLSTRPDAVLLGGDISEADRLVRDLADLEARLQTPTYFVLGNHDFYRGCITETRAAVSALARRAQFLHYLPDTGVVEISPTVALVGVDGWGDARFGNTLHSPVILNDFLHIQEIKTLSASARRLFFQALGDEEAQRIRTSLAAALDRYPRILLLTHVPPFRESAWHQGRISDDDYLPYFSCKAVGDVILELLRGVPEARLTVLCGHTHSPGEARPLPNVHVRTCASDYGMPQVAESSWTSRRVRKCTRTCELVYFGIPVH
ncbi:MAG: metallophosphoesterase [Planctomycetes bacterium]|nr:metallophosphoesterase [Planctomycetota bacterium]